MTGPDARNRPATAPDRPATAIRSPGGPCALRGDSGARRDPDPDPPGRPDPPRPIPDDEIPFRAPSDMHARLVDSGLYRRTPDPLVVERVTLGSNVCSRCAAMPCRLFDASDWPDVVPEEWRGDVLCLDCYRYYRDGGRDPREGVPASDLAAAYSWNHEDFYERERFLAWVRERKSKQPRVGSPSPDRPGAGHSPSHAYCPSAPAWTRRDGPGLFPSRRRGHDR